MEEIAYVSPEAHKHAREIESRFTALPREAGIVFIGVRAVPAPEGKVGQFEVRLGLSRHFEESTGLALIKKVMEKEIQSGFGVGAAVYRGVPGASSGQDTQSAERAGSDPS